MQILLFYVIIAIIIISVNCKFHRRLQPKYNDPAKFKTQDTHYDDNYISDPIEEARFVRSRENKWNQQNSLKYFPHYKRSHPARKHKPKSDQAINIYRNLGVSKMNQDRFNAMFEPELRREHSEQALQNDSPWGVQQQQAESSRYHDENSKQEEQQHLEIIDECNEQNPNSCQSEKCEPNSKLTHTKCKNHNKDIDVNFIHGNKCENNDLGNLPGNKCELQKEDLSSKLEDALPLLEKISHDIEKSKEESTQHLRNDFPCPIDGVWLSSVAGVALRLVTHEDGKINVTVSPSSVGHEGEGYLTTCAWHLSGLVPSKRQGPFALAAVCGHQHRIATFIGQCKVCEESETIFGNWMFSRISRDCNEAMSAVESKPDVWRIDHADEERMWQSTESSLMGMNASCATPIIPLDEDV